MTGIFLMMFGAALVTGFLVHVFLISLFIEAAFGRVWRILAIVPVAAYGSYYYQYFQQSVEIERKASELRTVNPGKVFDFDPSIHLLVTADASRLVQGHAIPVAYESNPNFKPEGHLSFRLIRRDQCKIERDSQARIQTSGMHSNGRFQQGVCELRFPEAPQGQIVTAVRTGDDEVWKRKRGISEQLTTVSADGAVLGTYRTASIWRLPALPGMAIGCALISSTPAWKCFADFMREHVVIDAVPAHVDRKLYDSPLSVMLALKKYAESDLANFSGYASNEAALARVAAEPGRVENDAFKAFAAVLDGEAVKLPFNAGYSLAQNPNRLAPFADKMAARFKALNEADVLRRGADRDMARVLATALVSLPREPFLSVANSVFDVIHKDMMWDRYPALYVRAADAGVITFDHYRADFFDNKLKPFLRSLPVLALCRVGKSDDDTIAEMKQRLTSSEPERDDEYKSALFVALMKFGQKDYLNDTLPTLPSRLRGWAGAVLEKAGETEAGPNNCMPLRWNNTDYLGPMLAPGLQHMGGEWVARARVN